MSVFKLSTHLFIINFFFLSHLTVSHYFLLSLNMLVITFLITFNIGIRATELHKPLKITQVCLSQERYFNCIGQRKLYNENRRKGNLETNAFIDRGQIIILYLNSQGLICFRLENQKTKLIKTISKVGSALKKGVQVILR